MAKLRHVAYQVTNAEVLKDFYETAFGFEQCYGPSASRSYMVMDGLFNLALLQVRPGQSALVGTHRADGGEAVQTPGINHFGFVVDDVDGAVQRVGSQLAHGQNPQDGRPAEMRVVDPWGNNFDLSARGYFGREEVRLPAVRQVVLQTDQPDELAEFYKAKLDLKTYRRGPDAVFLTDGLIRIGLVKRGLTEKRGIQYIGIQIDGWDATVARFQAAARQLDPPKNADGEVTVTDPEGNLIVLSQKGW